MKRSSLGSWRRDLALAALAALVSAAFRLPRLGFPPEEVFDEVYHAKSALQYLHGEPPVDWVHPPTSKLLIAVGVHLYGYVSWAWRLAPALAGITLAFAFYLLARSVLATERAAVLATVLLLADGVYLVQSRIAMTNIFAVLFQVGSALFMVRAGLAQRTHVGYTLAAGLLMGLAISTRWTSLWATAFLGLVWIVVRGRRLLAFPPARLLAELGLAFFSFLVIPAGIYVLSYVPWMRQGHSLSELLPYQQAIWRYHADLRAQHPYFSAWYTWPWLYRPTWYYFKQDGEAIRGIVALGNPALWWASVPVTLWALLSGLQARDPRRIFTGLGFCALYLPWGVSPRILNYSHYLFEALPYACLSLGGLLDRGWDDRRFGAMARVYVSLVLVLFLFFLPLLVALPVPGKLFYRPMVDGFRLWTWFDKWI